MGKIVCTGYENQGICAMCGGPLGKSRRIYCCEDCATQYRNLFYWPWAKYEAIKTAHHKCQRCGITGLGYFNTHRAGLRPCDPSPTLEVHHIIPLNGAVRTWHPLNIPPNLLVVCHDCHVLLHTPSKLKAEEHRKMQPVLL